MDDALRERVEALERAVTDGEHDLSAFAADAAALDRLETLEADVEELAARVEELEAATQALRGYVGNVRSVNTEVEQRADAALAKAEALEDRVSETTPPTDRRPPDPTNGHGSTTAGDTPDGGDEGAVDEWEWVTDDATGGGGVEPSGNDTDPPRHGDGAGRGRSETTTNGGQTGRNRRGTDGSRCASCGRPHTSDGGSAPEDAPGREPVGVQGRRETAEHATTGSATASDDAAPGAPTVTEIAESDPPGISPNDGAPGDDGDVLPDGSEDPLIGSGDDDRPGTLQRIRDLL